MHLSPAISRYVNDARVWIVFFFLLRLVHITQPPLEVVHNWRQCTVAMAARNFCETDNNILMPRLDIGGSGSGVEAMEFPLLNYAIYIVARVFGYDHWYGRLLVLLVSSVAMWYFYKILRLRYSEKMALYAMLLLQCSLWLMYMRKMMPDTWSVSLIIIGMYCGLRYLTDVDAGQDKTLNRKGLLRLGLFAVLVCAGLLSKISSVPICAIAVVPLVKATGLRKVFFAIATLIALGPVMWWYFLWVPWLTAVHGTGHFFMGVPMAEGAAQVLHDWKLLLGFFYFSAMKYVGFGVFVMGAAMVFYKKEKVLMTTALAALVLLALVLMRGGGAVLRHDYYIIPYVPVMAAVAAYGLSSLRHRWFATLLLAAVMVEGVLNQLHDLRIKPGEAQMLQLEAVMDKLGARSDLIAINSPYSPTPMYWAHRKGWLCSNDQLMNFREVYQMAERGLRYIVIMKNAYDGDCQLVLKPMYEDELVRVYAVK